MKEKTKTALILVDLQNDFFPGGALAVKNGDKILPVINRLLKLPFDVVVATKDWHPKNHGSFAKSHGKQAGEHVMLAGVDQILWPTHCVQDSMGAEFAPGWDLTKVQKIFYKGTDPNIDSYSTFFDNGRRKSTSLDKYLLENGVREVFMAGLATDYCVKYSALDAVELGFNVYLVVDGCRGVDLKKGDSARALKQMQELGAVLLSIEEAEKVMAL